jgi:hypothetical protein
MGAEVTRFDIRNAFPIRVPSRGDILGIEILGLDNICRDLSIDISDRGVLPRLGRWKPPHREYSQ